MDVPEKKNEDEELKDTTIYRLWHGIKPNARIEKHKTSKDILNGRKQEMRDFLNKKGKRR